MRTRRLRALRPRISGCDVRQRRKNNAYEVFVATPETPEMLMCAPLVPSKKSTSTHTGSPSRVRPTGRARSRSLVRISSTYMAFSRSSPMARKTSPPESGAIQISGETRTICTVAVRDFSAGKVPSIATRLVSDSNAVPS